MVLPPQLARRDSLYSVNKVAVRHYTQVRLLPFASLVPHRFGIPFLDFFCLLYSYTQTTFDQCEYRSNAILLCPTTRIWRIYFCSDYHQGPT